MGWLGCSNVQILGPNEQEPPPPTACICPKGLVLARTTIAQYLNGGSYPWQCSEADAFAQVDAHNSCPTWQTWIQGGWVPWTQCCVPPPPIAQPEPGVDLGGGTGSEPNAEPEAEHLLTQLGTKFSHHVQVQAHKDHLEVDEREKFSADLEAKLKKVIDARARMNPSIPMASRVHTATIASNGDVSY